MFFSCRISKADEHEQKYYERKNVDAFFAKREKIGYTRHDTTTAPRIPFFGATARTQSD